MLTFFSGTIMNASLPEITAQYVTSGRVYDRISGTGIAEADKTLSIYPPCSGVLAELSVRSGDRVKTGDLLCTITPETASADGDSTSVNAYYSALQLYLQMGLTLEAAQVQLDADKDALRLETETAYQLHEQTASQEKCAAFLAEKNALSGYLSLVNEQGFQKLPAKYQVSMTEPYAIQADAISAEKQAQEEHADAQSRLLGSSETQQEIAEEAYLAMEDAYDDYLTAHSDWQNALGTEEETMLEAAADSAWTLYESCTDSYDQAVRQLDKCIQAENNTAYAKQSLEDAQQARTDADKNLSLAIDETIRTITRDSYLLDILIAEAAASEKTLLYNEDGTVSVYAETDGTVLHINGTAGDAVMTAAALMQLAEADSTYTVRFQVHAEKTQKLQLGTEAVVINADAQASLKGIYPAAQSASGGMEEKTLLFTVTGDVSDGQSLAIKLNENSQNYEFTVPSRAISEDNNGTFILAVETKSTPLGNRYSAKRIDIAVLADDGTTAAIDGEIGKDTYVISLSTEPIQHGDMVRMKETAE